MSIAKIQSYIARLPLGVVVVGTLLFLLLAANGILGTYSLFAGIVSHARDSRFDAKQEQQDKVIDSLTKQAEDLRKQVAESEGQVRTLRVEIEAKDSLISSAGARIEERSKQIEEIKNDLQKETDRIESTDNPESISDELRTRLKKRGLIKESSGN